MHIYNLSAPPCRKKYYRHLFCSDQPVNIRLIVFAGVLPGGRFSCPVCRVSIQLPQNGVSDFPYNHLIVSLADTINNTARQRITPSSQDPMLPTAQHDMHGKPETYLFNLSNTFLSNVGGKN